MIGYQEVIQGLSRDDVYSYYKLAYQPNNMMFVRGREYGPGEDAGGGAEERGATRRRGGFSATTSPPSRRC